MVISHLIVDKSINSVAIIQSYLSINYRSFQYIYLIKRKILTAIKKIAIIGPSYPYKGGIAALMIVWLRNLMHRAMMLR